MSKLTVACPECGNDVRATVYEDSEGDFNVIGGIHRFITVEDLDRAECEMDCGATDEELENVLADEYGYDDGPDPDEAYDRARDRELEGWW